MTPKLILHASKQPYLSVGILSGGIKYNGKEFVYIPHHDAYLRVDYIRKYTKHKKENGTWDDFIKFIENE